MKGIRKGTKAGQGWSAPGMARRPGPEEDYSREVQGRD